MTDTKRDDGGPLFPPVKIGDEFNEEGYRVPVFSHGASVWCLFAAEAMGMWRIDDNDLKKILEGHFPRHNIMAKFCGDSADAMIAEYRERWPK